MGILSGSVEFVNAIVDRLRATGPVDLLIGAIADGETLRRTGGSIVGYTPAAGGVAVGTAVLDFGAFPGKSDASVDVIGQGGIVAGSVVSAWLRPAATADHTADEHMVETIKVFAGNIIAGTGFTIYGFNTNQINEPLFMGRGNGSVSVAAAAITTDDIGEGGFSPLAGVGGMGTRIYGQWTVAWSWS